MHMQPQMRGWAHTGEHACAGIRVLSLQRLGETRTIWSARASHLSRKISPSDEIFVSGPIAHTSRINRVTVLRMDGWPWAAHAFAAAIALPALPE